MSILKGPWSPGPWAWRPTSLTRAHGDIGYMDHYRLGGPGGERVLVADVVDKPDATILELALPAIEALARVVYDHGGGDCDEACPPDCAWRLARGVLARVPGGWDALHAQLEAYTDARGADDDQPKDVGNVQMRGAEEYCPTCCATSRDDRRAVQLEPVLCIDAWHFLGPCPDCGGKTEYYARCHIYACLTPGCDWYRSVKRRSIGIDYGIPGEERTVEHKPNRSTED